MLSISEQYDIQYLIKNTCDQERNQMRQEAELTLLRIGKSWNTRALSSDELKAAELATEILARIDASEQGKGWFYRAKRRFEIKKMYLG